MANSNPFKRKVKRKQERKNFETLFKDLKRDKDVQGLFGYQEHILDDYENNHTTTKDIGLELPTGSGKTLVGLLIGEWRRTNLSQRILYLSQTRQLAHQVYNHSEKYGIDTKLFVGKKKEFDRSDVNLYRQSKTIAISTYSAFFNYNPEFKDPQTIIMDDVHGAESYIGSLWSIEIERFRHREIYDKIIQLFNKDLPDNFINVIESERRELIQQTVEKLPFNPFYRKKQVLIEILDEYTSDENIDRDLDILFPWLKIKNNLQACHMYISYDKILIRPYILPTLTHSPFKNADQRIYMSATLGNSGELERITGIGKIIKLSKPSIFETRGIGQRFYVFPDFILDSSNYNSWIKNKIDKKNRTLILCPNNNTLNIIENFLKSTLPHKSILKARDVEESLDQFTTTDNSILLLANRYDGIDISDNKCEQIILYGLPSGTSLQEVFLHDRLHLDSLLRERILTRIQQASGRCTRSDIDKALIIMADNRLLDFCLKYENQKSFHPQIRGEVGLFFEVSPASVDAMDSMINSFYTQDENWDSAKEIIAELRDEEVQLDTMVIKSLANSVQAEVDFVYDMWAGTYENALARGKTVIEGLHGPKLEQYRALWCYYVATCSTILSEIDNKYEVVTREFINRARDAMKTNSWFPYAFRSMMPNEQIDETNEMTALAVEGILNNIRKWGFGKSFNKKIDDIESSLYDTKANVFDSGLVKLGELLGFSSFRPAGSAAPDAAWYIGNHVGIVFEGKSNENPEQGITIDNCTQTTRHLTWAQSNDILKNVKIIYSVLVSPKKSICNEAVNFGNDVNYVHVEEVRDLFKNAKRMVIESRGDIISENDDSESNIILSNLYKNELIPEKILILLTSKKVSNLKLESEK